MTSAILERADLLELASLGERPSAGPSVERNPAEFYRSVLESLSEGVVITDAQWQILYANRAIERTTGFTPEELVGRKPADAFGFEQAPDAACRKLDPVPETETDAEIQLRTKSGELRWVAIHTTPFRNRASEIVGRVATLACIDRQKSLEVENEILLEAVRENLGHIVGASLPLKKVLSQIATVAPTDASVLVLGESGTGKELVARAVHDLSPRKSRPLVRVNCASIPKDLFESEFFGHVRGAFTNAHKDRAGRFELADGGTLFLDEIGEIPLELQSKLLRVLQEGQFERVGDERTRRVNVRIIAATNRDLAAEAKAGRFRLDLFYRLSVFPIDLPPLRERADDIAPLAAHFVTKAARRLNVPAPRLAKAHLEQLRGYDWPGNIRELENVIERAVILSRGARLHFDLKPASGALTAPAAPSVPAGAGEGEAETVLSLDELAVRERMIVQTALTRARWKIYGPGGAAELLRLRPTTLVSMIKRLGLVRPDARR